MLDAKDVRLEDDAVVIEWSDGHVSRYGYRSLRLECCCAQCVEELTGRRLLNAISIPPDIFAVDYLRVGRYALQFAWSDGHATGIYPFRTLRQLCPCGEDHSAEEPAPEQGPRRAGR